MHATQQNVTNGNFNLFVAPQSSSQSQSSNALFTLEPSTTHSPSSATRSLPMKQRGPLSSHLSQSQGTQETCEHSEKIGMRQETDRVGNLHSKLKQEADKIRRWKTSMEMELKDKSEHIKDMTSLIEEQRKSLLEVQLEYEKVSGLLQEERGNQDQLGKQLTHTRELFSAVTHHVERVEQEVWKNGVDGDDLSNFQEQLKRRYEDLCENFSSLQGRCDIVTGRLESELGVSREECRSERDKNEDLLGEATRLTKEICEKTQLFEESLVKLTSEISERERLCEELRCEKESLRSQLTAAQREIETVNERCETLSGSVVECRNDIRERDLANDKYQNQCNELITELDVVRSSRKSLESLNLSLQNCVEALEEKGNKSSDRLSETECRADKIASDLVNAVNQLSSEKGTNDELRERVTDLEKEKLSLERNLSSVLEQLDEATFELKQLEKRLRDQLDAVQSSLTSLSLEKEESSRSFLDEIFGLKLENERVVRENAEKEKLCSLSEQLEKSLSFDNETMKQRCEELESLLDEKTEQAKLLTSDLEGSNSVVSSRSLELEELVRTIEEMEIEKSKRAGDYAGEVELLKGKYSDQLILHSEEVTNLKSLHQSELLGRTESFEEMRASQVEEHRRELERVLAEKGEIENELISLKQQISSLKEELSLSQNSAIQSKAELCVERELSEKKVSEMFASLCKYKQESESIVSANNKQLEEIKLKHSVQLKEELNRVNCELNSKLMSVISEKTALEEELSKCQKERKQEQSNSDLSRLSQSYSKQLAYPALKTPKTPRNAVSHTLPPKTPKATPLVPPKTPKTTPLVPSLANREVETEPQHSKEILGETNFRTPSIHNNSSFKQKRKKIRLDDVSMEILNSQDDPASSKVHSLRRKPTKNISTPSQAKENIRFTPGKSAKGKESKNRSATAQSRQTKDYNWFDSDMVFGLGTDD